MDWTTAELATAAGVSQGYVRQDILGRRLKARKRGHMWLIDDADAQVWLNNPRRGSMSRKVKGGDADSKSEDA